MKRSNNTSTGTKKTFLQADKWETIEEMPIYNWIKICETGDLKYIFKNGGPVNKKAAEHWIKLQQQYIDEFGLDDDYKKQLRLIKEITILNSDFVIKRDRFLLNLIKIKEAELRQNDQRKAMSFYQVKDYLERFKGFKIDPKTTTVLEWYYSLKNMTDGQAN